MSTTNLTNEDINYIYALYMLYAQRGSFQLEEYGLIFAVYSKIKTYLIEIKTHEGKEEVQNIKLEFTPEDLQFTMNVLKVCSTRQATDVDEMSQFVTLYNKLKKIISENTSADNGVKAIENNISVPSVSEVN